MHSNSLLKNTLLVSPLDGPTKFYLLPAIAPQSVLQRSGYVLSSLWYGAHKRPLLLSETVVHDVVEAGLLSFNTVNNVTKIKWPQMCHVVKVVITGIFSDRHGIKILSMIANITDYV